MKPIQTDYTRNVICPYCGFQESDSWERNMRDGDMEEIDCDCGETFIATCQTDVTYSTEKILK